MIFYNITVSTFVHINSASVNIRLFCLKYIFPLKSTTVKMISLVLKCICFVTIFIACFESHLAFMRYCARLMLAGVPVMVI